MNEKLRTGGKAGNNEIFVRMTKNETAMALALLALFWSAFVLLIWILKNRDRFGSDNCFFPN
jgi:hypothetical protein